MIRPDFYAVLGVSPVASAEEIRQAYHHLARQHHPDAGAAESSSERFKLIAEAYQVLSTPQLRVAYDNALRLIDQRHEIGAAVRAPIDAASGQPYGPPSATVSPGTHPALR